MTNQFPILDYRKLPINPFSYSEKNMALYNTLGIGKKATDEEIKKAYRKLALK